MSPYLGFVFGGVSCMCAALGTLLNTKIQVTHPIDTIKVRLQLQGELRAQSQVKYQGLMRGITTIVSEEGVMGLYKGITASLLREGSYSTLRMGLYEPFKRLLQNPSDKEEFLWKKVIAGGLSGACGSALANPTDLIKVRLQADASQSHNVWSVFLQILRTEGWKGLYRGIGPTTQRAMILTASQLPSYDHSKRLLVQSGHFHEGILSHCICSMVAGLVCATTTSPIVIFNDSSLGSR